MPVVCPKSELSPVWVEDVARVIVSSLTDKSAIGQTYELCGGQIYTLMELWQLIAEMTGHKVDFMALPDALSRFTARLMGLMPSPMMTFDNYLSLQVPSVCSKGMPFDIQPRSLRSYAMQVLSKGRVRQRYDDLRRVAGRDASDRIV
jgi:NADH dehydrogenase